MVSGILTPETSILVAVASRNLWFTLLRGVPLSLKGPVTRSSPVSSCFRTTTLFPLWTPARRMATVPADSPLVLGEEVDGGAGSGGILGGVVIGQLLDPHHPGAAILGSTNLLLHKHWRLGSGLLSVGLLGELVDGLLVVSGALTKPVHSCLQGVVTWLPFILVLSHTSLVEVNQAILAW